MTEFIFTTTGTLSPVKFEELGVYFDHPTSAYTLTDYFDVEEIREATTIQDALDNGYITAIDENGNGIIDLTYMGNKIPKFNVDTYTTNSSYIGYGSINTCKILQVITISGLTYSSLWANGDEELNKVWANRASYSYF